MCPTSGVFFCICFLMLHANRGIFAIDKVISFFFLSCIYDSMLLLQECWDLKCVIMPDICMQSWESSSGPPAS